MKNILVILLLVAFVFGCKNEQKTDGNTTVNEEIAYASFGDKIEAEGAIGAAELAEKYKALAEGDTLVTKVTAKINEVCSTKGCWMRLDLENNEEVMVRF